MLLTVDIGNSHIKFGVFDQGRLTSKFSIPTERGYSSEDISHQLTDKLDGRIKAAMICSVVPDTELPVARYVSDALAVDARFVKPTDDLGLSITFPVETTGTDRLVNSFAAAEKYGVPCIVISLGTATTFDVVNEYREYLGGVIAPGMKMTAKALEMAAAKLPEVEPIKPDRVIATTTESAIRSGIVYGQIAMIDGLIGRIQNELGDAPKSKIIATGGYAREVTGYITSISIVDTDLTLTGLQMLYERRRWDA